MTACPVRQAALSLRIVAKSFADAQKSVCLLTLAEANGAPLPPFLPGQYLPLRLTINDPRSHRSLSLLRCYSLCCRSGLDHWQIAVKKQLPPANSPGLPAGLASSYLQRLRVGDMLSGKLPEGNFILPDDNLPLLMVAGGSGITPLLAMLDQLQQQQDPRPVHLVYCLQNSRSMIAPAFLNQLSRQHPPFRLSCCFSKPQPGEQPGVDYQLSGHLNLAMLRQLTSLADCHLLLCAPAAMMSSLLQEWTESGLSAERIHYESFSGSPLQRSSLSLPSLSSRPAQTILLQQSRQQFIWQPQHTSLLQAAEQQGIDLSYGCRAGNCGTCELPLLQGEVDHSPLSFNQPRPGHCLPCIAIPKTPLILDC
ncbi:MAG: iron-sulfur cluster-binding domain-containing protein [Magnetococcales bacterium]|nr:iron-sulfur cluster-binding domain-containing protein [Magnetococcales bacterium]